MNSSVIVKMMTNLINKKFYDGKDEAIEKLDVYFAMNRISEEDGMDRVVLADEMYPDPKPEPTTEPAPNPERETPVDPPVETAVGE